MRLPADIHDHLKPGGLLISKTWCFGDVSRKLRFLFRAIGMVGLFSPVHRLTITDLRTMIGAAGVKIVEHRILGTCPQKHYIVARKPCVDQQVLDRLGWRRPFRDRRRRTQLRGLKVAVHLISSIYQDRSFERAARQFRPKAPARSPRRLQR